MPVEITKSSSPLEAKEVVKSKSAVADPAIVTGIVTSLEDASLIVIVIVEESPSSKVSGDAAIDEISGSSSLSKLRVISVSSVDPLTNIPMVNTIVSITSTSVSSTPKIVTDPVAEPAGIVIDSADTVYSPADAEPDNVRGIVISCAEIGVAVAVSVTPVVSLVSTSVAAEKAKVTTAASSLSSIFKVIALSSLRVAFVGVPGVTIIVSSISSVTSSTVVKVIVPDVSPAKTFNCGSNWYSKIVYSLVFCCL